jgi:hypothetical protein
MIYFPLKKRVLFRAGYNFKEELPKMIDDRLREIYRKGEELVDPLLMSFETDSLDQKLIPAKLSDSRRFTIFLSSLGNRITKEIKRLIDNDENLSALLLDAWASESVEAINQYWDNELRKNPLKGTMRFSPGYGDLSIEANVTLIELFKQKNVKVKLESSVLIPEKSTICMIGWR